MDGGDHVRAPDRHRGSGGDARAPDGDVGTPNGGTSGRLDARDLGANEGEPLGQRAGDAVTVGDHHVGGPHGVRWRLRDQLRTGAENDVR